MTGAGSGQVVFVKESSFQTEPGTPTYYAPGRNVAVEDLSLENQLQRLRTPSNVEAVDSIAGNFEGAFGVSYTMSSDTHDDVRDIVFNNGGTSFTTGLASTSSWYVGSKFLDTSDTETTVERNLTGTIPLEYAITYQQDVNTIRETLTMAYADESRNTSFTPGSVTRPADGNDVPFHGASLTIDNSTVSRLQSATLRFNNLYRYIRDPSRWPATAVTANPTTTLEAEFVLHTDDYLELAYGGQTGDTAPESELTEISNSDLTFDDGGGVFVTYTMSELEIDSHTHNNLANADEDDTEQITAHVNGGISIS